MSWNNFIGKVEQLFKLKKESRLIFYEKIFEIRNTNVPLQNIEYFQNVKMFHKKLFQKKKKLFQKILHPNILK